MVERRKAQAGWTKNPQGAPPIAAFQTAWFKTEKDKGIRWHRTLVATHGHVVLRENIFFPVNTGMHWMVQVISLDKRAILNNNRHSLARHGTLSSDKHSRQALWATSSVTHMPLNHHGCFIMLSIMSLLRTIECLDSLHQSPKEGRRDRRWRETQLEMVW